MPTFTAEALLAFVLAHKCVPPAIAPVMVGVALHENPTLDPAAINLNLNGTADVGIAQVNTSNFGWTGLTQKTALDPCANIHAAMMVFFAKYNGNPPDVIKVKYAHGAEKAVEQVGALVATELSPVQQDDAGSQPDDALHDAVHSHTSPHVMDRK